MVSVAISLRLSLFRSNISFTPFPSLSGARKYIVFLFSSFMRVNLDDIQRDCDRQEFCRFSEYLVVCCRFYDNFKIISQDVFIYNNLIDISSVPLRVA